MLFIFLVFQFEYEIIHVSLDLFLDVKTILLCGSYLNAIVGPVD